MSQKPALVQITTMREAFFQEARRRPKGSIGNPIEGMVRKKLKGNPGRIYHRKGWFVTRKSGK